MPRCLRVEYKGASYHVMSRGNRGVRLFETDEDVALWLETLGEACERSQLIVPAYFLMSTHYHLLLKTPEASVGGMVAHSFSGFAKVDCRNNGSWPPFHLNSCTEFL